VGVLAAILAGAAPALAQCGPDGGDDGPCSCPPAVWINGSYQGFVINRGPLNTPLVTTSSTPDLNTNFGALGQSGTTVLYGANGLDNNTLSGFLISGGVNFTQDWALEFNYFFSEQTIGNFAANSDAGGNPVLARPVFLVTPPAGEGVYVSSFPGETTGGVRIYSQSRLQGTEEMFTYHAYYGSCVRLDLQAGFKYLRFDESLDVVNTSTVIDPNLSVPFLGQPYGVGSTTTVHDHFGTSNRFVGGELGVRGWWAASDLFTGFSVDAQAKVGVGSTTRVVQNYGQSSVQAPNAIVGANGGILVAPSNTGRLTESRFTAIPETVIHLNYDLNRYVTLTVGYNLIYWNNVARPGDSINRNIDNRQVPTDIAYSSTAVATTPPLQLRTSELWANGFTAGLLFSY
jgi:hypothetical protein